MADLVILGVIAAIVLLYAADRAVQSRVRARRLRSMSERLAAAAVRAEEQQAKRRVADAAQEMVRLSACIEPRPEHAERLRAPYLRLVDELERRTWLPGELAAHCRARARR